MKISRRLETIAEMIPSGSRVIDVGCDHALLDIYLSLEKQCECVAADINANALDQARYNILRFQVKSITPVLTDGLEGISVGENDIVVISGMGTSTIEHILTNRKLPNHMIIGTHTDFADFRKYVVSLGYAIQDEKYVEEKKKAYIIIDFIKDNATYTEEDFQYGPILKHNIRYIENEREKVLEIISRIPHDDEDLVRKKKILEELLFLKMI